MFDDLIPEHMTLEEWFLAGVDGIQNVDRLAAAMAKQKSLRPLKIDRDLETIIEESNEIARLSGTKVNYEMLLDLLDSRLVKHNTYLDQVIHESSAETSD